MWPARAGLNPNSGGSLPRPLAHLGRPWKDESAPRFRPPAGKGALDLAGALLLVVVVLPALVVISVALRLSASGSVLSRCRREGLDGRPFHLLSFRGAEAEEDDPLGALLHRSGLDRLPQLFNVLRGDMSLVGPRPRVMADDGIGLGRRLPVKPGLTGLHRLPDPDGAGEEAAVDRYAMSWSLALDLSILRATVVSVLRRGLLD